MVRDDRKIKSYSKERVIIMGMHHYDIYILLDGVAINNLKELWCFKGISNVILEDITKILNIAELKLKKLDNKNYILNKCIEVELLVDKQMLNGFKLSGCFSCFQYGLKGCFEFINFINRNYSIHVNVLGNEIIFEDFNKYQDIICQLYHEKYELFKKGHPKFDFIIPPCSYYKKMKIYQLKIKLLNIKNM